MRIAFYAPLKPPDHDIPSGDRRMARAMVAALELAGHEVVLASRTRAWSRTPADLEAIRRAAMGEAADLLGKWQTGEQAPDLFLTYHLYYRAPDWIGPAVAAALDIPYAVAEASFAMKRAAGPWAPGHDAVAAALRQAGVVFALKDGDIPGLAKVEGFTAEVVPLPPFLDGAPPPPPNRERSGVPVLLAVGMMRARAKLDSYRFLAAALKPLAHAQWSLIIAGDGPARGEVEAAFAGFPTGKVRFAGVQTATQIAAHYAAADLFVWPGIDEGYGMVYLEAQAAGLPVVATASGGVHNVVADGVSGRLVARGNVNAYRQAIEDLLNRPGERRALGARAARYVRERHALPVASATIDEALQRLRGGDRKGS
ncbi:Putative glycosyltransferase [hydrothermal vent metagenome]|uniref:Glycosyltransferase n=1 Tax=hydrothermal vent metagenome TaxID=652676 RepID=A0A3B0TL62_9ZZZZ